MYKNTVDCFVFVGPTIFNVQPDVFRNLNVQLLEPVRRGDIDKLISERPSGNIAIVDGTFHSYPSVGHVEIQKALLSGWNVWGLSSMGAIRAAELHQYGMKGFGRVYQEYIEDTDFSDDEVTLVHESQYPYRPISEPLIHIREFVSSLVLDGHLTVHDSERVLHSMKNRWYGARTMQLLKKEISKHSDISDAYTMPSFSNFRRFRVKTLDLVRFFEEKPWEKIDD